MQKQFSFKLLCVFLLSYGYTCMGQDNSYRWNNVAIGGGGFVSGIIMSKTQPGVMYARTDVGGAYRWNPDNRTWIPLQDWVSEDQTGLLGVESIAMDPSDNNKIYMLAGISYFNSGRTAILRSRDGGNTFDTTDVTVQFRTHGNGTGRQNGEKLAVDPRNGNILYCGTRYNGIFKSMDAGLKWNRLASLPITTTPSTNGVAFVVLDSSSATAGAGTATQTVIAGISKIDSNIYISNDGGLNFTLLRGGPATLMPHRAVLSSNRVLTITFAAAAGPGSIPFATGGQIWQLNLNNNEWKNITPPTAATVIPPAGPAFSGISVDPKNPNRILASTINTYNFQRGPGVYGDRFFLTNDGGTTWRDLGKDSIILNQNGVTWIRNSSIHWTGCIEFNPFNTAQAWVTSGNGIFSCDNLDVPVLTWRFDAIGLEETVPIEAISIPNGPLVSVIGDYDGFVHSDITKFAPIHIPRMGSTSGLDYATLNTNYVVRVATRMYYSTNQGATWTKTDTIFGMRGKVAVSANGSTLLYSPQFKVINNAISTIRDSTTWRSVNNGSTWTAVNGVKIPDAKPVADAVNSNKFYIYSPSTGIFYVSTDGGLNFVQTTNLGASGSRIIRTVLGREGDIWAPLYGGGLTHSTNSGQTFTKVTAVTQCTAVGLGKAAPGATYPTIYIWGTISGVRGMYRSIDSAATWIRVNDDAHEFGGPANGQFVVGDQNVYGRVYMSTAGRGIVYGEPNGPTAVEDKSNTLAKDGIILYPNPSSDYVNVVVRPGLAGGSISVFDMLGRKVNPVTVTNQEEIQINTNELAQGLYVVQYQKSGKTYKKTLSVKR